jgi:hypothetical protein
VRRTSLLALLLLAVAATPTWALSGGFSAVAAVGPDVGGCASKATANWAANSNVRAVRFHYSNGAVSPTFFVYGWSGSITDSNSPHVPSGAEFSFWVSFTDLKSALSVRSNTVICR